jgi:ankyrin repeat protein
MLLCRRGNLDLIKLSVEKYKPDLNIREGLGNCYAYEALLAGNKEVFFYLLDHGADPELMNISGSSPIILAIKNDDLEVLEGILQRGLIKDMTMYEWMMPESMKLKLSNSTRA